MIPAARHLFLMLCNPVHSVTAFELPVYHPSEEERRDPRLYAANVRKLMVRGHARPGSGCACTTDHACAGWLQGREGCVLGIAQVHTSCSPPCPVARSLPLAVPAHGAQLDFSGLQSTSATYTDKMAYMQRLKQEYGLS